MGLIPTSLVCPLLTHRRHSPDTTQYTVHPQYHVLHYNASDNNSPSASSPPPKLVTTTFITPVKQEGRKKMMAVLVEMVADDHSGGILWREGEELGASHNVIAER